MPSKPQPYRPPGYRPPSTAAYQSSPERRADMKFYNSAAWHATRHAFLKRFPLCATCEQEGRATKATEVHHHPKRKLLPPSEWHNFERLQGQCKSCHSKATRRGE
ncbi:MAG: HNH endonuclease [Planctomycetia bacterium]|nr:HNH endonuclease [Planctomycetia bacterium]